MTVGASDPEHRGSSNLQLGRGAPDDLPSFPPARQRAAGPHDRGHEGAGLHREDAQRLRSQRTGVRGLHRPVWTRRRRRMCGASGMWTCAPPDWPSAARWPSASVPIAKPAFSKPRREACGPSPQLVPKNSVLFGHDPAPRDMPGANTVTDTVKAPELRQTQIAYSQSKTATRSPCRRATGMTPG